jgi:putative transposase
VLAWELSTTLDVAFCLVALDRALVQRQPEFFNRDQGTQVTSQAFTGRLEQAQVRISMDGRGRPCDNIVVERLWRTVKYEDIYLKDYSSVLELHRGLTGYFEFYNQERPHQGLNNQTPATVYSAGSHDNGTPRLS